MPKQTTIAQQIKAIKKVTKQLREAEPDVRVKFLIDAGIIKHAKRMQKK